MLELVLAVTLAITLSAMCSLFEAVLYSVPLSQIESMVQQGRPAGGILKRLRKNVDRPITAILTLNTIANTAGAAVAGAAAVTVFGHAQLVYFSVIFTLAILFLSEVLPKTAGVVYSRPLSAVIARPLQLLVWLCAPIVWLVGFATRLMFRAGPGPAVSEEELIMMARLGLESGAIEAEEADVIQNILGLGRKIAREVMTPRSVTLSLHTDTTAKEARDDPRIFAHSRLPVHDESSDDVVGLVLRRNILAEVADNRGEVKVGELMSPVHFVGDTTPLDQLLRLFLERRQHLFVVIDEHGGVGGIVTLEDVLEEILGREIMDESDEVADMRQLAHQRRERILHDLRPDHPTTGE
jgi:CBS domain containing-hemolysin-like protein